MQFSIGDGAANDLFDFTLRGEIDILQESANRCFQCLIVHDRHLNARWRAYSSADSLGS
jgi:hypothetical protein